MLKNNKVAFIGNVFLAICIIISTICFMQIDASPYITKTIASSMFVVSGLFNIFVLIKYYKSKGIYKGFILLAGLIFAMIGDILLIDFFILGAIFFAIGHLFFFAYFSSLARYKVTDFIVFLILITISLLIIFLYPYFDFNGLKVLIIAYACIICLMFAKSISNYYSSMNKGYLISLIGTILFFFSDMMLLFYVFGGKYIIFDYLCVYTYYPGEALLALSILLNKENYESQK